jgi:hypothetical protein
MSVSTKFERFLSNVELLQSEVDDARQKHTKVRTTLHNAYYSFTYDGSTSFLIGSYRKSTAIRPTSDIDIMFILPDSIFDKYNKLSGNKQSRLLQDVKDILERTYPRTEVRADGPVVVVPLATYKIEVAPCFELQNSNYWVCDTKNGGRWKEDSPKKQMGRLTDSNKRSNGNTVRLIKMVKVWKRVCNVPLKNLAIELLAQEFLTSWEYYNKTSVYHDWMIRDFFSFLKAKSGGLLMISDPLEFISLGSLWFSKAESAYERAKKACDYESEEQDALATLEWRKIFGSQFLG